MCFQFSFGVNTKTKIDCQDFSPGSYFVTGEVRSFCVSRLAARSKMQGKFLAVDLSFSALSPFIWK